VQFLANATRLTQSLITGESVKAQLDSMEAKGVIEKVSVSESIEWLHPMVVIPKKNSPEPQITIYLQGLNAYVKHQAYPTIVPRHTVARIPPGNKFFTTLDAQHGYSQHSSPSRDATGTSKM
jgi:hypothetical protein